MSTGFQKYLKEPRQSGRLSRYDQVLNNIHTRHWRTLLPAHGKETCQAAGLIKTVTRLIHGSPSDHEVALPNNLCKYFLHCCIKDCIFALCESVFKPLTLCLMARRCCRLYLRKVIRLVCCPILRGTCEGLALVSWQIITLDTSVHTHFTHGLRLGS